MRTMEKNLIAINKEADKLRAEVQNAKMRAQETNSCSMSSLGWHKLKLHQLAQTLMEVHITISLLHISKQLKQVILGWLKLRLHQLAYTLMQVYMLISR